MGLARLPLRKHLAVFTSLPTCFGVVVIWGLLSSGQSAFCLVRVPLVGSVAAIVFCLNLCLFVWGEKAGGIEFEKNK